MSKNYDFLIIGAGISGLSCALLLARFGHRVAVLEQAAQPAPLVSGFKRAGIYFETGFHYAGGAGDDGPLECNLQALGLAERLEKVPLDRQAFDTVRFTAPDFEFSFPQGYERLTEGLLQAFPEQHQAILSYLEKVRETAAGLPYYEPDAPAALPDLAARHGATLAQVLDRFNIRGRLRNLFEIHCLLHGAGADEIPFLIHAGVVDGYYRTAHTFKGGGRALARALVETAEAHGIEIFCRSRVEAITRSTAGTLTGVRCRDKTHFAGRNCILTAHPAGLLELLPEKAWRPAFRHRLAGLEETIGADLVFLSTSAARKKALSGRNFYFFPPASTDLLNTSGELEKRLLYLNFAESNGTDGGITAILPGRHYTSEQEYFSSPAYELHKRRLGEEVKQRIRKLLPELGDGLEVLATASAKTLQAVNASPRGSMYGVKHKLGQFNPGPRTRIPGLYLAGQGITAPGLLGATTSAFLTVGEIVGHQRLQRFRREKICDA